MIQFCGTTAAPWKTLPSDKETSRSCARELCAHLLHYMEIVSCLSQMSDHQVEDKQRFVHTFVFKGSSHCLHSQSDRNKTFKVCLVQWILRAKVDPYWLKWTLTAINLQLLPFFAFLTPTESSVSIYAEKTLTFLEK